MLLNNIFLRCQCRSIFKVNNVISNSNLRLCSSKINLKENDNISPIEDSMKWSPVYKFSHIRLAASLNKIKVYQTLATCIGVPGLFALETFGIIPAPSSIIFAAVGVSSSLTLFFFGALSKNTIGIVYINDALDKVKLSYINFWGKRTNDFLQVNDIILSNTKSRLLKFYIPVKTVHGNKVYRLLHRYGTILDVEKFSFIFGDEI